MCRAQEKKGSHKRISKPYQRLVRSGRAVKTLPIRANWETGLNLKIKDEEQQLTCLVTENIALNAWCNLIFQNHDHKHLRLLFNSITQTIKVSVGLRLSWVRRQRNNARPGWLWSHNGTDTELTPGHESTRLSCIWQRPVLWPSGTFWFVFRGLW